MSQVDPTATAPHAGADSSDDAGLIQRRAALKAAAGGAIAAAAFAGPGIGRITLAPAYGQAASGCSLIALSGWTHVHTPTTWQSGSGNLGYFGTPPVEYTGMGAGGATVPVHLVEADPPAGTYPNANGTTGTATYTTGSFTLNPGFTYTFTFNYRLRDFTTHVARQLLEAQYATSPTGPWTTGFSVLTPPLGTGTRNLFTNGTGTVTIDAEAPGTYYFRYRHSFLGTIGTPTTQRANDVAVTLAQNVACAATP